MRNHIIALSLLSLSTLAAACDDRPVYKLGETELRVTEQSFGAADYFCPKLANGQFLVILDDFLADGGSTGREMQLPALCEQATAKTSSREIFHKYTNTNMRLVIPRIGWTKIPPTKTFRVGPTDCANMSGPDTEAAAWFSHHTEGNAEYDLNAQAESGTITVSHPGVDPRTMVPESIKGTFDLNFGGQNIKGSFEALLCNSIVPGFGS